MKISNSLSDRVQALVAGSLARLPDGPFMVAASGGPDSCALAVLGALSGRAVLGHVNHHLQPSCHQFEQRVVELGESLGLRSLVAHVDGDSIAGGDRGLEAEARSARYRALAELWDGPILTAHTAHDRLDTVLMRLVQGTGFGALDGPRERVEIAGRTIVRPMLDWFEADVAELLESHKIAPALDPTNSDQTRLRNAVRPIARQLASLVGPAPLARSLRNLAVDVSRLRRIDEEAFARVSRTHDDETLLHVRRLGELEPADAKQLITRALVRLGVRSSSALADRIGTLAVGERARGSGVVAEHCGSALRLRTCDEDRLSPLVFDAALMPVVKTPLGTLCHSVDRTTRPDAFHAEFDQAKVVGQLRVRTLRQTDRFVPHGLSSEVEIWRRLSKDGWPETVRNTSLVLADDAGVLWVLGLRRGSRALVNDDAQALSLRWAPW